MGEQEQVRRSKREVARETTEAVGDTALGGATERGDKLKTELDGLLDEIDEVLEVNAEEFVRGYVQKGGE